MQHNPHITVLLIGFDGRRQVFTDTHDNIFVEFMHGDGGPGCNGVQPCGWQYWVEQTLGTTLETAVTPPTLKIWEIKN